MAGEAGFRVATAYVVVEPDTDGFGEKLKADLEKYDFTLKIDVEPDMDGFAEKVQAEVDALKGDEVKIPIDPDADGFREKVAAETAGEPPVEVPVTPGPFEEKLAAVVERSRVFVAASGGDIIPVSFDLNEGSYARTLAAANALNAADRGLTASLRDTGNAARDAGNAGAASFRLWGTGIRVGQTALHGVISSMVELAAVVVPATVAAGAWAAVWAQGAGNVYEHMQAVYTATEADNKMFHETAGQAIGLGDALQKAQDAANPKVYQALGAGLEIVKGQAGALTKAGTQVGDVFDAFAAKLAVEFGPGGSLSTDVGGLLSHMVGDLTGLGQVVGNVGHMLLAFASQMPGLAEVMLGGLAGVTHLATSLLDLSGKFRIAGISAVTAVFALHEFNTWGSVLVGGLGKMGLATEELSGNFFGFSRAAGVFRNIFGALPALLSKAGGGIAALGEKLPLIGSGVSKAGTAMKGLGDDTGEAVAGLSTFETLGVAAAVAGLGILIYKIATFKTAAQSFVASLQDMVQKANNLSILRDVGSNLGALQSRLAGSTATMNQLGKATNDGSYALGSFSRFASASQVALQGQSAGYRQAASDASAYRAGLVQQIHDAAQTVVGAEQIARAYHITIPQAMALAQTAGVNLTNSLKTQSGAWNQLGQQVKDQVEGFMAMGQPMGAVGADMAALAIQSGLAATKMSALNQAWDQFMQNLTGGTTGLAGFEQTLTNLTTGTSAVTTILGKTKDVTLSVKDFADSLKSFTGQGAQAWQNFGQVVGTTAPQLIDWLRTAGAEGALSGKDFSHGLTAGTAAAHNFQQGVLDMMAQLTPLASKSQTAQAQLVGLAQSAGLNIKTFPQLEDAIKNSHASVDDLQKIVGSATTAMANMSKIAQNLGNVMSGQVTSALSNAALKASGFYQDVNNLTEAQQKGAAAGHNAAYWAQKVAGAYDQANASAQKAAASVTKEGDSAATAAGQMSNAAREAQVLARWIASLKSKTINIDVVVAQHGGLSIPGGGGRRITAAGGAVIPGYAPGLDSVPAMLSPGEGVLVPEAVKALGPEFVHAANAKFGGPRVARGNKTGHYASGGISASASFGFPTDVFNINVEDTINTSSAGDGGSVLGELRPGKSAKWAHDSAETIVKAFADGSLKTAAQIRAESAKTIAMLKDYYAGPAASKLESAIRAQTASMEKLAKVSATIAAMKQYASQVTSSLAGDDALSNITGGTTASGGTGKVTGAEIRSGLQKDLAQLHKFFDILGKLKKMKLSKALLSQVAEMAPADGIQYGEAIISGGEKLIREINKDEQYIQDDQRKIGQRAADIKYGQNINKGFLKGLEGDKSALERAGQTIARELAKALGIPLSDIPHPSGGGGHHHAHHAAHHHAHHKTGHTGPTGDKHHAHKAAPMVTVNLNGSKGKLSHEEVTGVAHEIGKMLSLA